VKPENQVLTLAKMVKLAIFAAQQNSSLSQPQKLG
jgi:hypothetical protein